MLQGDESRLTVFHTKSRKYLYRPKLFCFQLNNRSFGNFEKIAIANACSSPKKFLSNLVDTNDGIEWFGDRRELYIVQGVPGQVCKLQVVI